MAFITTVIPVYNGERYLFETLDALAKQTVKPNRVIIQDNCSTDGTRQVYEAFRHFGFEWHQNPAHVEAVDNFNNAFSYADQTEYLHVLCADDVVLPRLFEQLLPTMEHTTGRALAYSAFAVIDEKSQLIKEGGDLACHVPVTQSGAPYSIPLDTYLKRQADLYTVMLPAAIMKTCRQPIPFGFSREYILASDAVFLAQWGLLCERIVEVPQVLCYYRRHGNSNTSRTFKMPDLVIQDEWKSISDITQMIPMPAWQRWIRNQRNKCYLSARSHVKLRLMASQGRDVQQKIKTTTRQYTSLLHWTVGGLAVQLRDMATQIK